MGIGPFTVELSDDAARRSFIAWITLYILGGHVLLPILVATFIFTRAKRHPVLINMCITWIITSIMASLLLYTGQFNRAVPDKIPCMMQAALMQYAVPPMISLSSFAVIYHVWTTVRTTIDRTLPPRLEWLRTLRTTILVTIPYIAFALFGIGGAVTASMHPEDVSLSRRKLYCSVAHTPLSIAVALFSAFVLLATMFYEIKIVMTLRRTWLVLRGTEYEENASVERSLVVRVAVFGVYAIIGFILSISTLFTSTPVPDMFIATVPVVAALLFGIQADIQGEWAFWRRWQTPGRPSIKGPRMKIEDV